METVFDKPLDKKVAELTAQIGNYVVIETVRTDFHAIAVGDTYEFTKSVTKTGYTPLGIVEITGGNGSSCIIRYFFISNDTMHVALMNNASANKNVNVDAKVLYVKS